MGRPPVRVEVCVDSLGSARAAQEGGAHALEVCAALSEGGLTPSYGFIAETKRHIRIPFRVLIRPRGGSFVYTRSEVQAMKEDIQVCAKLGVEGAVIGALLPNGDVDVATTVELVALCMVLGLAVTFHRAFDHTRDPMTAHKALLNVGGISRLLTSGQQRSAAEGTSLIARLVQLSPESFKIMAGGGLSPENASYIVEKTQCAWIHGSFRTLRMPTAPIYANPLCPMSAADEEQAGALQETNTDKVRQVVKSITDLG